MIAALLTAATIVHAGAPAVPPAGCSWYSQSNPDVANFAYPDANATYWGTQMIAIPKTGLIVHGRFPHARYFSIIAYDPALRPVGGLRDDQIDPQTGVNRFRTGRKGDGTYTIHILATPAPAHPAPNTIYAGAMHEGEPNPGGFVLYRVYVPDDPADPTGGAGLPDVSLDVAGATTVPFAQCRSGGGLPSPGVNQLVAGMNYPAALTPPVAAPSDTNPPTWQKFYGYSSVAGTVSPSAANLAPGGGGFLSNVDNEYIAAGIERKFGDLVVFRALMPTFPDTRAGAPPWAPRQVRYWSICENETVTERYVACTADYQAVLDPTGHATFVISDPDQRPTNADAAHAVNWLPWGGAYPDGRIIYRQMLAAPSFRHAIAQVSQGEPLAPTLGAYLPAIAYCTKTQFERTGADGCLAQP